MYKLFKYLFILILLSWQLYSQPAEIHCKHFFYGYPLGTPKSNDLIIRDIYAMSNNDSTKFADWVAYRLDLNTIKGKTHKRVWKVDPYLDEDETLEPADYKGAYKALKVDRGHQAPLASFLGTQDWYMTNYLSNITPQKSILNRGEWKYLEMDVRKLLVTFPVIYVMTGPLYEKEMPKLPNADEAHVIPSGYWKIIIVPINKTDFITASFIFDQNTGKNDKIMNHIVTINEIEKRSHLDFLWELDDKIEDKVESKLNKKWCNKFFNN